MTLPKATLDAISEDLSVLVTNTQREPSFDELHTIMRAHGVSPDQFSADMGIDIDAGKGIVVLHPRPAKRIHIMVVCAAESSSRAGESGDWP